MSYPQYPRPPMNASFPSNIPVSTTLGQSSVPPLTIIPSGTTVLAFYQNYAWYFGKVQNYNLIRNGTLVYQIHFPSGEIRPVPSSQVLSQQSNNLNIEIGSRVVVQHPTKSMFISSLVAEPPSVENIFRYLLFLDDGSSCYKTKDKLWVINLVENPISLLPNIYKTFIHRYFTMNAVKLIHLNPNDSVNFSNYDGTSIQFSGKVVEVDCSIALIRYNNSSGRLAEEWIHRGSSRILSYGHNQNLYYGINDLQKHANGANMNRQIQPQSSTGNMPGVNQSQQDNSKFMKSPLKGKPFMVPPSLDPFMFSEDESMNPTKTAKFNTQNSWPVSNTMANRTSTFESLVHSQKMNNYPQPQSPILILDESPAKNPPPYSSPNPLAPSYPSTNNNHQSPKFYDQSLLSPSSNSPTPTYKPASVFSWSASEESGARRRLSLSPKLSCEAEADFDFADTILTGPVTSSSKSFSPIDQPMDLSYPLNKIKTEEIVITDDELPPLVIETVKNIVPKTEVVTQSTSETKPENSTNNVPMILHQEACFDGYNTGSAMETESTVNGNVIEVVVHSGNNGESCISVTTPSIEIVTQPMEVDGELEQHANNNGHTEGDDIKIEKEDVLQQETSPEPKTRKRRLFSPNKSPKMATPKVMINLKALELTKDLAAQKCVKRARKQQSKEHKKDLKQSIADKKKKIAKASEPIMKSVLLQTKKKDQIIRLNSEAKISNWHAPWSTFRPGKKYHDHCRAKIFVGEILEKVALLKTDEELEEGELDDDSDSEENVSKVTFTVPSNPHSCSFLCNTFSNLIKPTESPLNYPMRLGWERVSNNNKITYISPCGIVCVDINDITSHLALVKSTNLFSTNFCFLSDISLDVSDPKPENDPLFSDTDLSNGLEAVPVPFVSDIGPIIKYSFNYVIDFIRESTTKKSVDNLLTCSCENICSAGCSCRTNPFLVECNSECSCSVGCGNRVIQRGLQQQLLIIQEDTTFKVRALHDIPKDSFICTITGVIKSLVVEGDSPTFLYPLNLSAYSEKSEPESVSLESEEPIPETSKSRGISTNFHDDSKLLTSSDLESIGRETGKLISKYTNLNSCWTSVACKTNQIELLNNPQLLATYPSLGIGRKEPQQRSKRFSSSSKDQTISEPKPSELFVDSTEYGNVGRFIPLGDDFNTQIRPVFIDDSTIPWLAVFATSNILKDTFLILKSLNR